jgi:hypothetical protein
MQCLSQIFGKLVALQDRWSCHDVKLAAHDASRNRLTRGVRFSRTAKSRHRMDEVVYGGGPQSQIQRCGRVSR